MKTLIIIFLASGFLMNASAQSLISIKKGESAKKEYNFQDNVKNTISCNEKRLTALTEIATGQVISPGYNKMIEFLEVENHDISQQLGDYSECSKRKQKVFKMEFNEKLTALAHAISILESDFKTLFPSCENLIAEN